MASLTAGMALTADDVALPGSSMSHIGSSKLALAALSVGAPLAIAVGVGDPRQHIRISGHESAFVHW